MSEPSMIIDCHGHYTTSPPEHEAWRKDQVAALKEGSAVPPRPTITDEQIRQIIEQGQLRVQRECGVDLTIFSPTAGQMGTQPRVRGGQRSLGAGM